MTRAAQYHAVLEDDGRWEVWDGAQIVFRGSILDLRAACQARDRTRSWGEPRVVAEIARAIRAAGAEPAGVLIAVDDRRLARVTSILADVAGILDGQPLLAWLLPPLIAELRQMLAGREVRP